MDEMSITEFEKDAVYWHLISKGYPEWRARAEAERITALQK